MKAISMTNNAKRGLHTFVLVAIELLVAVALGCALWFALRERLTYTVQVAEQVPATASTPAPVYDPAEYPEELVALYARNPDARQFVLHYPAMHDAPPETDLSALAGTDSVPQLYQWDERWGYETYNGRLLALTGCGPTCLSMVDIYLTGHTEHDPGWMARYAEENGYNEPGNGTKWTFMTEGAQALGIGASPISLDEDTVTWLLEAGAPIVCAMGPGDFTDEGHFLVLTGVDADGGITLNDPNSRKNSARTWTFAALKPQIRGAWCMYIP